MPYLRLLRLFARTSLLTELEYRANFVAQSFLSLVFIGVTIVTTLTFFSHTDRIGGWTLDEALIVAGMYTLINGLIKTAMQPNVQRVIEMIRDGTLDFALLKPVNSQFMATTRHLRVSGLTDVAAGIVIITIALRRVGYAPDSASLAAFALMTVCALIILYSVFLVMATTSFWFVKVGNLTELFTALFDTGRFPITAFRGTLRVALTFVVPIAFITTFPAQAVLRQLEPATMGLAMLMALAMFGASAWFWRRALRSYSSASS